MQQRKNIISAITASLMLCSMLTCIPAGAEELTQGDLTYENRGVFIAITGCNENAVTVDIPAEIDGLPVTWIDEEAFYFCSELTAVTLPDTIEYIADEAFDYCRSLTQITIPASVVGMGQDVFNSCIQLETITVAEGNPNFISVDGVLFSKNMEHLYCYPSAKKDTSYVIPAQTRGTMDFENKYLTSVTIPAGMDMLEGATFSGCSALTEILVESSNTMYRSRDGVVYSVDQRTLVAYPAGAPAETYAVPDGVTEIGMYAFKNSKLKGVILPDSVDTIGDSAFYMCKNLENIVLPDSLTTIKDSAFGFCYALPAIDIPDSVTELESWTFMYCKSLTEITIPDSITEVEAGMFQGCEKLAKVNLPKNATHIGMFTFCDCTALQQISLPASMQGISIGTFKGCTALTDVYFAGSETAWNAVSVESDQNETFVNATMHFGEDAPAPTPTTGDLNADSSINASDAAMLLTAAAAAGTGADSGLSAAQLAAADLNKDGAFDAKDAALILQYAAYTGTGGTDSITDFIAKLS